MSDTDCLAYLCGGCCIGLTGALQTWYNTNAFGARCCQGCCGGQGCCGSCFQGSLDEDNFDEQLKRERERTKDASQPVETQPEPSVNMTADMVEDSKEGSRVA